MEIQKRNYVNLGRLEEPKRNTLFVDFIRKTVERKQKRMKKSYRSNYFSVIKQLEAFCKKHDAVLYVESINEEFFDDFICFMEEQMLRKTYIKATVVSIQAMVRRAGGYGYAVDPSFDDVKIDDEESTAVYLSPNEIARIYYFIGLRKSQDRVRDLFILGCCTALRISDLLTLSKENFGERTITKTTLKTGARVVIPIHDFVREIYDKYNGELPTKMSPQYFNNTIKMICKKVGINDKISVTHTVGGVPTVKTKEKWQLISSHTARRSGATNLYNSKRMRIQDLMIITGHSSERSFMRYVKTSKDETAKQMEGDVFFRK